MRSALGSATYQASPARQSRPPGPSCWSGSADGWCVQTWAVFQRPWWAVLCSVAALALLFTPPWVSPADSAVRATFALAVVSFVVAGLVMVGRPGQRGNATMLLVLAVITAGTQLQYVGWGPWSFLGSFLLPLSGIVQGHLLLRWPNSQVESRRQRDVLRVAYIGVPALHLADALAWDPAWQGYTGQAWWPTLVHHRQLENVLFQVSQWFQVAGLVTLLVLVGARLLRATRLRRFELASVAVSAAAFAVLTVLYIVGQVTGLEVDGFISAAQNLTLVAVPLGFLISTAVRRIQRALAVESLLRPERVPDAASIRLALSRVLDDRDLTLALWSPAYDTYLAGDGGPAPDERAGAHSILLRANDGSPLARIGLDPRLEASSDVVEAVTRAAGLPLENARLLAELQASQLGTQGAVERLGEAEQTTERLSRLLPGGLAARVGADPEALTRTELLTVTVLMSDVRGYTGIAEQVAPADLAAQLNAHRQAMNDAVLSHGGTVMQYVGDAVMAVFGAPERLAQHESQALEAAAAMHRGQHRLNELWAAQGLPPFGIGIGLSTGPVAAAFLGSTERMEYTVVGDTVNLSARLCDLARPAGTTVASAATLADADDSWERLDAVQVKGRAASVSAYRLSMEQESGLPEPTVDGATGCQPTPAAGS